MSLPKAELYQKIILDTNDWFNGKMNQLDIIAKANKEVKIFIKDERGSETELPEEHRYGFMLGVKLAIETIGKFPVTITKENGESEDQK